MHLAKPDIQCCDVNLVYDRLMAELYVWVLWQQVTICSPQTATQDAVNDLMCILKTAARKLGALADSGYVVQRLENMCSLCRKHLDLLVWQRQAEVASRFTLPPAANAYPSTNWPSGVLPKSLPSSSSNRGIDEARSRAQKNLRASPILRANASLGGLVAVLNKWEGTLDVELQLRIQLVEGLIYKTAAQDLKGDASSLHTLRDMSQLQVGKQQSLISKLHRSSCGTRS